MDIITPIVQALSAGAASALQTTTSQAVKDAYEGVKALIKRKFGHAISVEGIEKKPNSPGTRQVLAEEIQEAGAENDQELFAELQKLIDVLGRQPRLSAISDVNIEDVKAKFIKIGEAYATGNFNFKHVETTEGIEFGKITAGEPRNPK